MVYAPDRHSAARAALPGLQAVDSRLVAGVVRRINAIQRDRGLELARQVGSAILHAFFRNQSDLYRSLNSEHMSFRSLAERNDLELGFATLYRYTAVEVQIRHMPVELAGALSVTHHVCLLSVRDPLEKHRFASAAVERGLTSRQLAELIRSERTATPRTGRPPLPRVLKATRGLSRTLAQLSDLHDRDLACLGDDQRQEVLDAMDHIRRRLDHVQALMARSP